MTSIKRRQFQASDVERVGDFLCVHYCPLNRDGNWLRPAWDYMHSHPNLDEESLDKIAVWERNDEILGVVHYEHQLGEAFFQFHPQHTSLAAEMLEYAEMELSAISDRGQRFLFVYINDFYKGFEELASIRGYQLAPGRSRPISMLSIPETIPSVSVPPGFKVKDLDEENDLYKINQVLWRGFGHQGSAPPEDIPGRAKMQSSPHFRKDLTIVVEAPEGQFVSYCGLWYVPENQYAYIEPMTTDPDFRRLGLGEASLWKGVQRCKAAGAQVAYVGSDQAFYRHVGFKMLYDHQAWLKTDL